MAKKLNHIANSFTIRSATLEDGTEVAVGSLNYQVESEGITEIRAKTRILTTSELAQFHNIQRSIERDAEDFEKQ